MWNASKPTIFHRFWWRMPQWVTHFTWNLQFFDMIFDNLDPFSAVILDHEYLVDKYESTLESIKTIVEKVIREDLKDGGLNIKYYSWSKINFNKGAKTISLMWWVAMSSFSFSAEFTAVLSVANCKNSWATFYEARKETLLLLALTDADCPRFPHHEALMVSSGWCFDSNSFELLCSHAQIPLIKMGEELPQIILDIRTSRAINWKTATLVYDSIFGKIIRKTIQMCWLKCVKSNWMRIRSDSRSWYHQSCGERSHLGHWDTSDVSIVNEVELQPWQSRTERECSQELAQFSKEIYR